ncbi:hypothetical protein GE09DRAFT_1219700 [Coniochaeta sp. 2T2.1]|nr:hypothetical protein GE09DRAFT_1219700 [Coniochaeta sp. 2T2.1]
MAATCPLPSQAYSDAPEVVTHHHQESGLETVEHSTLEAAGGAETWKYAGQPYSTLETQDPSLEQWKRVVVTTPTPGNPAEDTPALPGNGRGTFMSRHRRRRKWYILGGIGGILAIIAIVVGCVVGLRNRDEGDSGSSSNDTAWQPPVSVCRNTICPQVIAVPQNYAAGRLAIFARGTDNLIHYRYSPPNAQPKTTARSGGGGTTGATGWQSIPGVEFLSQPTAMAWNGSGQVQVAAIASGERSTGQRAARGNVFTTSIRPELRDATFEPWFNLGETAAGAAPMCVVPRATWYAAYGAEQKGNVTVADRLDVWTVHTGSRSVVHDFWAPDRDAWMSPETSTGWDERGGRDGIVGSVPAVTCRDGEVQHDLLVYTPQGTARWRTYSNRTGNWSDWEEIKGTRFMGDPVTVAVGSDRWDFFGIEAGSKVLQHARWTAKGGMSGLEPVGNLTLASVPSVVVAAMGREQKIDVVALGSDDRVMHQCLVGATWNQDWEAVLNFGNSAPALTYFRAEDGNNSTAILVLDEFGGMSYAHWTTTASRTWNDNVYMNWTSLGGNWTTDYMQVS